MATKKKVARKASAGSSEPLIVYIHGIGEHPPKDEMKRTWDLALFGRDMGTRTVLAYWADILHPPAAPSAKKAKRVSDPAAPLSAEALLAEAGVARRPDAVQLADALLAASGAPIEGRAARTGPGKKVMPLPAALRRPLARAFLEALVKDTAAYFFRAGIRQQIQQRLKDVLPKDDRPVTIVAHSQGTIVSYEVLRGRPAPPEGAPRRIHLVTLGSPLGIQEVQDFLDPAKREVPTVLRGWHNFADPLDPVAIDKAIRGDFTPTTFILDDVIANTELWRLEGLNPHSAVGYLSHPRVRDVVHRAAQLDTHARFLVARDVVERLAVAARQPVLIELLEPGYPAVDESLADMRESEAHETSKARGAGPRTTTRHTTEGRADRRAMRDSSVDPAGFSGTEPEGRIDLQSRVDRAATEIEAIVERIARKAGLAGKALADEVEGARIDRLRRFVAARLTPTELELIAAQHRELRVYAMWKSAQKRKLIKRSDAVIKVDAARASFNAHGAGIRWAVLDTGIQADHPHFSYEVSGQTRSLVEEVWDCTVKGPPKRLDRPGRRAADPDGHGTHVAGIIAGAGTDQDGVLHQGMAPRASLVVYKVLDDAGQGEDAWIIKALDHIAAQNENSAEIHIHGLNLSLGGPYDATVYGCGYSAVCAELRRLWRAGVLVVVASGNEGVVEVGTPDGEVDLNSPMSIGDPANLEDCIAVGSVNADRPNLYGVSSFSSRGPTADGRVKPDVVAPGERIRSCNAHFRKGAPASHYRAESGTSMAAPHVSGLLAAFLSVRREFRGRPDEVKELLLRTCTDIRRDRYHQGHGIPNLMRMLLDV